MSTKGRASNKKKPKSRRLKEEDLVNARMFARIKPLDAEPGNSSENGSSEWNIVDFDKEQVVMSRQGGQERTYSYLERVFEPEEDQEEVFETVGKPLVDKFVQGFPVNLLAFGQTGSGKTHTIFGPPDTLDEITKQLKKSRKGENEGDEDQELELEVSDEVGLMIRIGCDILERMDALVANGTRKFVLVGQMVELRLWNLYDLIRDAETTAGTDGELHGVKGFRLKTPSDVMRFAAFAEKRTSGATRMNESSSRSHCVTIFQLIQEHVGDEKVQISNFQIFDMMGSERSTGKNNARTEEAAAMSNKASVEGWEGIFANWSLHFLSQCVDVQQEELERQLRGKKSVGNVAQRTILMNYLTVMLRASFDGHALTTLLVTLSQASRNGNESHNSLDFGKTLAKIRNVPQAEPLLDKEKLRSLCRTELAEAKAAMKKLNPNATRYIAVRKSQISKNSEWLRHLKQLDEMDVGDNDDVEEDDDGQGQEEEGDGDVEVEIEA